VRNEIRRATHKAEIRLSWDGLTEWHELEAAVRNKARDLMDELCDLLAAQP